MIVWREPKFFTEPLQCLIWNTVFSCINMQENSILAIKSDRIDGRNVAFYYCSSELRSLVRMESKEKVNFSHLEIIHVKLYEIFYGQRLSLELNDTYIHENYSTASLTTYFNIVRLNLFRFNATNLYGFSLISNKYQRYDVYLAMRHSVITSSVFSYFSDYFEAEHSLFKYTNCLITVAFKKSSFKDCFMPIQWEKICNENINPVFLYPFTNDSHIPKDYIIELEPIEKKTNETLEFRNYSNPIEIAIAHSIKILDCHFYSLKGDYVINLIQPINYTEIRNVILENCNGCLLVQSSTLTATEICSRNCSSGSIASACITSVGDDLKAFNNSACILGTSNLVSIGIVHLKFTKSFVSDSVNCSHIKPMTGCITYFTETCDIQRYFVMNSTKRTIYTFLLSGNKGNCNDFSFISIGSEAVFYCNCYSISVFSRMYIFNSHAESLFTKNSKVNNLTLSEIFVDRRLNDSSLYRIEITDYFNPPFHGQMNIQCFVEKQYSYLGIIVGCSVVFFIIVVSVVIALVFYFHKQKKLSNRLSLEKCIIEDFG